MGNRSVKIVLISGILLLPTVLYVVLIFGEGISTFWHQAFAAKGVAQIEPASQMDAMYDDCRHFITYEGNHDTVWNSVAYFGGRYELTMQVPVAIRSSTTGKMTGEPRFYLNEVSDVSISPSGQIGASFSRNREFGPAEWKKVLEAKGDFGAIGFKMNTGPPIKDFDAYAKGSH